MCTRVRASLTMCQGNASLACWLTRVPRVQAGPTAAFLWPTSQVRTLVSCPQALKLYSGSDSSSCGPGRCPCPRSAWTHAPSPWATSPLGGGLCSQVPVKGGARPQCWRWRQTLRPLRAVLFERHDETQPSPTPGHTHPPPAALGLGPHSIFIKAGEVGGERFGRQTSECNLI